MIMLSELMKMKRQLRYLTKQMKNVKSKLKDKKKHDEN